MSITITFATAAVFLPLLLFASIAQGKNVSVTCGTLGNSSADADKYYECVFNTNGTLSYKSYQCPAGTCFDHDFEACTSTACKTGNVTTPPSFFHSKNINHWINTGPEDEQAQLRGRTFSFNRTQNYTLTPQFNSDEDEDLDTTTTTTTTQEPLWVPSSTYYNCTNRRYNCSGPGLFADPMDNTIFYKCRYSPRKNKWRAVCFQCNEKYIKCFSEENEACVNCDDLDEGTVAVEEIISQTTSYDCVGYSVFPCSQLGDGLHEHPGDQSIAVRCSNETWEEGEWMGGCISCPKKTKSCFIEGIGQCIENCKGDDVSPYDCSMYKLNEGKPCTVLGKFPTPFDDTTYFQCVELKDGSGRMMPECQACPRGSLFHEYKRECIQNETIAVEPKAPLQMRGLLGDFVRNVEEEGNITTKNTTNITAAVAPPMITPADGYDCKLYHEGLFPCRRPGYYANPNDTSVYYSCWPLPSGGYAAVCYTCNKLFRTCYDDFQKACVTVGKNETCGTSMNLMNRTDKGTPGSSRTYSCVGYTNLSFPCRSYAKGFYAMPGDTSVYVHCEDMDGDTIPEFASCHACDKGTNGCFNMNLSKCVNYCRSSGNLTDRKPLPRPTTSRKNGRMDLTQLYRPFRKMYEPPATGMPYLTYDCDRVAFTCTMPGVFVNTMDTSVWFECFIGRRFNDWGIRCRVCPFGTCFDVRVRACTVSCRRINYNWRYMMCRDHWSPLCDMLGIG